MNLTGPDWRLVNIGSGNVLLSSGNKQLPGSMSNKIYVAIWRHYATMGQRQGARIMVPVTARHGEIRVWSRKGIMTLSDPVPLSNRFFRCNNACHRAANAVATMLVNLPVIKSFTLQCNPVSAKYFLLARIDVILRWWANNKVPG